MKFAMSEYFSYLCNMLLKNKELIGQAILKAAANDVTKLMGLCCECSIIAFKALKENGLNPVMVDGTYHGYVSDKRSCY